MKELSVDQALFLYLNGRHSVFFDWIMSFASNTLTWIPIYLIVIFIFLRFLSPSYFRTNITLVLLSIGFLLYVCAGLLPSVFPYIINRVKPCYDAALTDSIRVLGDECGDRYGFYAFRACTVFAISTYLWLAFDGALKWMKVFLVFWAIIVCYSRIYLGAHYPLNVLVSAFSGIMTGYLTFRFYHYIKDSILVI